MAKKTGSYTVLDLAKEVIQENKRPLTAQEIWNSATNEQKNKLDSEAANKVQTIYCSIYQNVRQNEDKSDFIPFDRNPVKWGLKGLVYDQRDEDAFDDQSDQYSEDDKEKGERKLHKFLVSYVNTDPYFSSCYCKTIFHEKSEKSEQGKNLWIHPDIVGVSYPFGDIGGFEEQTLNLMKCFEHSECRLFSFEMRISIKTYKQLREYFFQAVSNSSWAHEGYLVACNYDPKLENEMRMLNESFGIGFIKLDVNDYTQSMRIFPAKRNEALDWNMMNRLIRLNEDFCAFIKSIQHDMKDAEVRKTNEFDAPFESPEVAKKYARKQGVYQLLGKQIEKKQ